MVAQTAVVHPDDEVHQNQPAVPPGYPNRHLGPTPVVGSVVATAVAVVAALATSLIAQKLPVVGSCSHGRGSMSGSSSTYESRSTMNTSCCRGAGPGNSYADVSKETTIGPLESGRRCTG